MRDLRYKYRTSAWSVNPTVSIIPQIPRKYSRLWCVPDAPSFFIRRCAPRHRRSWSTAALSCPTRVAQSGPGGHSEQITSNALPLKRLRHTAPAQPLPAAGRPRTSRTHCRTSRTHPRNSRTHSRTSRTLSRSWRTLPRGSRTLPRASRTRPGRPGSGCRTAAGRPSGGRIGKIHFTGHI